MALPEFRLVNWILQSAPKTKYDLSSSGLREPQLETMGVDTSYGAYRRVREDHERLLAEELAALYGVEAGNVVVTTGASEAIFLAYSVFGRGRAVVPLPNYEPMFAIPRWLGMGVTTSQRRPVVPGAVYGITNPNNPTGSCLDAEALALLVQASKSATVFINETYGGFTFGKPSTLFARHERFVTGSSMTKFYGLGGLRVGWMMGSSANIARLRNARRLVSGHNSEYSLWIAKQVLTRRDSFVERARRIQSENLQLVRRFAASAPGVEVTLPEAAPFCLVRYSRGPASVAFAEDLLERKGVLVSPGDYFGAPKAFRLCFTADREEVARGLDGLSEFLNALR